MTIAFLPHTRRRRGIEGKILRALATAPEGTADVGTIAGETRLTLGEVYVNGDRMARERRVAKPGDHTYQLAKGTS